MDTQQITIRDIFGEERPTTLYLAAYAVAETQARAAAPRGARLADGGQRT